MARCQRRPANICAGRDIRQRCMAAGPEGIYNWNGSEWASVPVAVVGRSMAFEAIFGVSADDIWAGGQYLDGSTDETLLEHWDGSTWTQIPAPNTGVVADIDGLAANDVWAVAWTNSTSSGSSLLHWDGSTWSTVATSPDGSLLLGVAEVSPSDVWVTGNTEPTSNPDDIGHWDGSNLTMTGFPGGAKCPESRPSARTTSGPLATQAPTLSSSIGTERHGL